MATGKVAEERRVNQPLYYCVLAKLRFARDAGKVFDYTTRIL
jgi:hypothetical protein